MITIASNRPEQQSVDLVSERAVMTGWAPIGSDHRADGGADKRALQVDVVFENGTTLSGEIFTLSEDLSRKDTESRFKGQPKRNRTMEQLRSIAGITDGVSVPTFAQLEGRPVNVTLTEQADSSYSPTWYQGIGVADPDASVI